MQDVNEKCNKKIHLHLVLLVQKLFIYLSYYHFTSMVPHAQHISIMIFHVHYTRKAFSKIQYYRWDEWTGKPCPNDNAATFEIQYHDSITIFELRERKLTSKMPSRQQHLPAVRFYQCILLVFFNVLYCTPSFPLFFSFPLAPLFWLIVSCLHSFVSHVILLTLFSLLSGVFCIILPHAAGVLLITHLSLEIS